MARRLSEPVARPNPSAGKLHYFRKSVISRRGELLPRRNCCARRQTIRTRDRSEPVAMSDGERLPNLSPRLRQIVRTRRQIATGTAQGAAGGCGAFGANLSADYQNGEPARTRRKIGTPRTCHRRRGFRTRDSCPVGRSDAGRFSKPYGNLTKSGARERQGRGGCFYP